MPINRNVNVEHNIIGDGFFKTMQIPIVAGRSFGPQDTATSQKVAVISEHTARTLFPAGSPIGRTYFIGSDDGVDPPLEEQVIGVAKDVKFGDLAEPVSGYRLPSLHAAGLGLRRLRGSLFRRLRRNLQRGAAGDSRHRSQIADHPHHDAR